MAEKISFQKVTAEYYDVLKELGNIGAGNATTALAQMLQCKVDMQVPQVRLLNFSEVGEVMGGEEQIVVGIYLAVEGDITGSIMFILEQNAGKALVSKLMGMPASEGEFNEMEISAMKEIGKGDALGSGFIGDEAVSSLEAGRLALDREIDSLYAAQQANSFIGQFGRLVSPALEPLGFNWKMDVGLITGIAAKELVVSTLGVMYSEGSKVGAGENASEDTQLQTALQRDLSKASAFAYMVFILLYFPCIATFVAIKNETGKWRWAIACCVYTMVIAWVMAFAAFRIGLLFY